MYLGIFYVYTIIYFTTNRFYIYKSFLLERVRVQNIDGCDNVRMQRADSCFKKCKAYNIVDGTLHEEMHLMAFHENLDAVLNFTDLISRLLIGHFL